MIIYVKRRSSIRHVDKEVRKIVNYFDRTGQEFHIQFGMKPYKDQSMVETACLTFGKQESLMLIANADRAKQSEYIMCDVVRRLYLQTLLGQESKIDWPTFIKLLRNEYEHEY